MRKKILLILAMMFIAAALWAKILAPASFQFKEFDKSHYSFILRDSMEQRNEKYAKKRNCHYAFKDNNNLLEVRYILFTDNGGHDKYSIMDIAMWAMPITFHIAGNSDNVKKSEKFDESDLLEEFNASYGAMSYIVGNKSEFTKGYKYVYVSYFHKEDVGVMYQIILCNDPSIKEKQIFDDAFHSFKFN